MNLREYARDKPCMVRTLACNGDPATTVLAHLRMIEISGMGHKAPDVLGAWCCATCHTFCDTHHDLETEHDFMRGVFRTQNQLIKEGKLKW